MSKSKALPCFFSLSCLALYNIVNVTPRPEPPQNYGHGNSRTPLFSFSDIFCPSPSATNSPKGARSRALRPIIFSLALSSSTKPLSHCSVQEVLPGLWHLALLSPLFLSWTDLRSGEPQVAERNHQGRSRTSCTSPFPCFLPYPKDDLFTVEPKFSISDQTFWLHTIDHMKQYKGHTI